uniref:Uncharacterized protein n=1 Tax=Glossina austeni TaxID=7395 RepID=A0A1A9VYE8_GLOAU
MHNHSERTAPLALPSIYNPPATASRRLPPQQLNKQSLRKCNDLFVYVYFLHTQTSIHADVLLCIFVCRLDTQAPEWNNVEIGFQSVDSTPEDNKNDFQFLKKRQEIQENVV